MVGKRKATDVRVREVLQAAETEFFENGYEGTTLENVAKRAGLTRSGMAFYFPSKESLLSATCDRLFEPASIYMEIADKEDDALAALHRFLTDYLTLWAKNSRQTEFYLRDKVNIVWDERRRALAIGESSGLFNWLYCTLGWGVRAGLLKPHNKLAVAEALMYAIEGAILHVAVLRDAKVKKAVERIERGVLGELLKKG